jgi:DNA polymerase-3 subunit epsilon
LLDAEILAEVYSELLGGKQAALGFDGVSRGNAVASATVTPAARPEPLAPLLTEAELAAHAAFVVGMGEKAIWNRYIKRD